MFELLTYHASVAADETMDDDTSIHKYHQATDHFIESGVLGSRPKIAEASNSATDDSITTWAVAVIPSIPAGPSKDKKPATRISILVLPLPPTARMQVYLNQLGAEKESALTKVAKIK